ncbi:MAG TPA: hypothetical protein VFZ56_05325 [Gemmatimonadaceae bacterium]
MRRSILCAGGLIFLAALACGSGEQTEAQPEMTQRQRDSAIGASSLPGARGVTRALDASDSAAARSSRLDSLGAEP